MARLTNICSMFCATPSAVDDYMDKKAIEDGNCSRQILCQLNDDLGADGAIFQPYTEHQLYVINTTLEKMMSDTYDGEGNLLPEINLDTSWIDSTVKRWCRLTSWKNWLQIPYYDIEGHLAGGQYQMRPLSEAGVRL